MLLTPWNYNDHDVSMESRNSVILNDKKQWVIDESVISSESCAPRRPPPLAYHGMNGWDEYGKRVEREELRLMSDVGTPLVAKMAIDGRGDEL